MARTRVPITDDAGLEYRGDFDCKKQDDGTIWCYLRVRPTQITKTEKLVREVTWSFAYLPPREDGESNGSTTPATWHATKHTMWETKASEPGDTLASLFAPPPGSKPNAGANIRILFSPEDVYGEVDERDGRIWWKLDAKEHEVWLGRPLDKDMVAEQKALWDDIGWRWVNLYTGLGGDPFIVQEPVAVGIGSGGDEEEEIADI